VLLALAIGAFLMAGLYYALDLQVNSTHAGRQVVERSALARSVVNRIQADIAANLGPVDPSLQPKNSSGSSGSSGSGSTGSGSSGSSSSGSSGSSSAGSGSSSSSSTANPTNFNLMVQGTDTQLMLYSSLVPREAIQALGGNSTTNNQGTPLVSDLRRITYWVTSAGGLARQEVKAVTSDDEINNVPPGISDEAKYVIAARVVKVQFQYYDGTTWQDSWDGTQPPPSNSSSQTPAGPPAAIAVTLTIAGPTPANGKGDPQTYQYRHVVPIPTANSFVAPAMSSSGSSGSSGTSSSGGN
jgi:hypothetical protein